MAKVTKNVEENFLSRKQAVLELIVSYQVQFQEVGIFGSYARDDYKAGSDIDFCIITEERPSRTISGSLREEAELIGADIIFVTPDYFKNDTSNFAVQLRRDFRRLL